MHGHVIVRVDQEALVSVEPNRSLEFEGNELIDMLKEELDTEIMHLTSKLRKCNQAKAALASY